MRFRCAAGHEFDAGDYEQRDPDTPLSEGLCPVDVPVVRREVVYDALAYFCGEPVEAVPQ